MGDNLSTYTDFDSEAWDTDFLNSITTHRNGDGENEEGPLLPPTLKNVHETIDSFKDVIMFLCLMHASSKVHSALIPLPGDMI